MKKFNKKYKIGTKVQIAGLDGWHPILSINDNRTHITIYDYWGHFQIGHVLHFTNK